MSKIRFILFVFVIVVLATIAASCSLDVRAEVVTTPTLKFATSTPGIKPMVTSTRPIEPGNPNLCFDNLEVASGNIEQFMIEKFDGWYSPLVKNSYGVWGTGDNEKNGFISINKSGNKLNLVVVQSGNAYKYGLLIPNISLDTGNTFFYGPTYKIKVPGEIKKGTIQRLEYWSYRGTEFVRYLQFEVHQEWAGYWKTVETKTESWYKILSDGTLLYSGENQPTSP